MPITFKPENSYPQNLEDGFPVGQSFYLIFSNRVDLKKFKECCVLFGKDFDRSSGPDNSLWLNTSDATNPFFLRSPGFGGFVDYDIEEFLINDYEELFKGWSFNISFSIVELVVASAVSSLDLEESFISP